MLYLDVYNVSTRRYKRDFKEGESIILTISDQRVQIDLSEAMNGQASISIDAPEEIRIPRKELNLQVSTLCLHEDFKL